MVMYFVWVPGLRGPEAQLWDEKDKIVDGKHFKTLTNPVAVESRDLDTLKKAYPYEAKE